MNYVHQQLQKHSHKEARRRRIQALLSEWTFLFNTFSFSPTLQWKNKPF
jgi:hypothetical protein